jgi:hypothetical protein
MGRLTDLIIRYERHPMKLTLTFSIPIVAVFVVLFISLVIWERESNKEYLELQFKDAAKAYFEQVLLTRRWNALHGGVYVEVTPETRPNPYLDDLEREIVSREGKTYTKINPAYMNRQISEIAEKGGYYRFKLSSFKPLNPSNKPDDWESRMLKSFEDGKEEGYGFARLNGEEYFRYMAPLKVEAGCLKCHEKHGYKVGDIRGGLSISIPSMGMKSLHKQLRERSVAVHVAILVMAMVSIVMIVWVFSNMLKDAITKEVEAERLQSAIHVAGAAAHELRQPMTIISGFSEVIKDRAKNGESINKELDIIIDQCYRMNMIITKMLNVTRYKLRSYSEDAEIFDFEVDKDDKGN